MESISHVISPQIAEQNRDEQKKMGWLGVQGREKIRQVPIVNCVISNKKKRDQRIYFVKRQR
jgi:hypothetical protein